MQLLQLCGESSLQEEAKHLGEPTSGVCSEHQQQCGCICDELVLNLRLLEVFHQSPRLPDLLSLEVTQNSPTGMHPQKPYWAQ